MQLLSVTTMYQQTYYFLISSIVLYNSVSAKDLNSYNVINKVLNQCAFENEMFKCLKIQVLKAADSAFQSKNVSVTAGVNLIQNGRHSKSVYFGSDLNETKLQNLDSEQLDQLLGDTSSRFLESHHIEINVPRLLEEGRKKEKSGGNGALYWALAIKGSFLAMAYQGIALMSGLALVMGKMALLLSAILGLKKLVNSGHESTTYEIIKQPKHSEQHTYSTSYEDEGHHHRSYDYNENHLPKKLYKTYI